MTPKLVRKPREWTETCRHCAGTGSVAGREHFALWTPDEFESVQTLDAKHDVPRDAYVCTASPGGVINEACREGIEIARIVGRPVAFEFNGAVVVCRRDDDPVALMKEWWVRAYGKTYEQSMRDR